MPRIRIGGTACGIIRINSPAPQVQYRGMSEPPISDEIDGDDAIIPESVRERGLVPGAGFFFIALAMMILGMAIAALLKYRG